jgi:fructose-1,6-bisphosphatase III
MAPADRYGDQELRLLQLLSKSFPNISAAHTEMINLSAILALPKGTDHYVSDIHGAYEQFDHILRHASGAVHRKIEQTFGLELTQRRKIELAMLIYYPEKKLRQTLSLQEDPQDWMGATLSALVRVARTSSQKYTRSKVRRHLAPHQAYILEELLNESQADSEQREHYYQRIIRSIVDLGEGERFIVTLAYLIQSLVVDRLYVLGDIFDRGPLAERVMDRLIRYHYVAIQWGNHDISWMGAAAGCEALVANVVRLALRYNTLETLSDGYGIHLWALARFAEEVYGEDPCEAFAPSSSRRYDGESFPPELIAKMHKAIALIQFKLEAQIIVRHPEYAMADRLVLDAIDLDAGTVTLYGKVYPLRDARFPTLNGESRAQLSPAEAALMASLVNAFQQSTRLQEHIRFLYAHGNMFQVQDGNLKFHGCVPVDAEGEFLSFPLGGEELAGPALLERFDQLCRAAFVSADPQLRREGLDAMWYLWCGQRSPLYGRERITTFERYFVADKSTHEEPKGPYYNLREQEGFCKKLLAAFGGDPERGHIINGHTPVKLKKGERPVMANGRLLVIDGGMSEAYQKETGIAGYTLISNSHGMFLAAHDAFTSADEMIARGQDVTPQSQPIETFPERMLIAQTDTGRMLRGQLEDLQKLVEAYRAGVLVERR